MRVLEIEGIVTAPIAEAVDLQKLLGKHIVEHDVTQAAAAHGNGFGL